MPDLDSFDIRDQSTLSTEEQDIDRALRPLSFDTFRGQDKAVENLKIFVQAAKMRSDALDHVLLYGPPGLGKTTLSHILLPLMWRIPILKESLKKRNLPP